MSNLDKIFSSSKIVNIDKNSRIVIMSDVHRGDGNVEDDFLKNEIIFNGALKQYFKDGYTYIELGDGDELWEVKKVDDVIDSHKSTYKILENFYKDNRLIMIYGNHDIIKSKGKNFYSTYLNDLEILESLILKFNDFKIFLVHGHQVELTNTKFINITKFFVRYVWKYLERIGINDPTSAAKNNILSSKNYKRMIKFSNGKGVLVISGHTHKPSIDKDNLYINTGSCIHPNGVTSIEIEHGYVNLVRWEMGINSDGYSKVTREILVSASLAEFGKKI